MTKQETFNADATRLNLVQLVNFARRHSPYYARHYQQVPQNGWRITDLPLVDPRDYWEGSSDLSDWPVLTEPFTDGIVFKTGGTTGACKLSVYTRSEWRSFITSFGRSLTSQLQPGDHVANLFFAGDLYASFLFIHGALAHMEMPVCEYPFSGAMESQVLFDQLKQHKINVLVGVPTMLLHFSAEIVELKHQLPDITTLLFGCESIFTEQLSLLKQAFPNARVASVGCASVDAGLIGASTPECLAGEHRAFEPETIVEIIDEATGEPILEADRTGMLVITNLTRKLMPLIRYPIGDIAAWREPPGSPARKFILQGRSSLGHRLRVGYASVFPDEFDALIIKTLGRQQWQLILDHHDYCDWLTLRIAFSGNDSHADALRNAIQEKDHSLAELLEAGQLRIIIEWCRQNELIYNSRTGKLQRVTDRRAYVTDGTEK